MAGLAAAFFVVQLWRRDNQTGNAQTSRSRWMLAAGMAAFLAIAMTIYFTVGRPELADQTAANAMTSSHPDISGGSASSVGSMAEATAKLASKLASGNGSDADWQLLQQSYEFMGDTTGAALAGQHQLKADTTFTTTIPTAPGNIDEQATLKMYQQVVAVKPRDAAAWLAIAQLQRKIRDFAGAITAYEHAIELKAMNADAWADYADASAAAADTLTNSKTRAALEAALKLEPGHSKALWLKASLAYEEHRYPDAVKLWQQLRAVTPDTSPDVKIIDANIAESRSLSTSAAPAAATKVAQSAAATAQIRGRVALDPSLRKYVTADMVLFVYAKSVDSAAPVAAYRTTVESWPTSFVLDDSMAMMPTRKLSQFEKVTVEARLSRSGQALAKSGDLQAAAVTVSTRAAQAVALNISRTVP